MISFSSSGIIYFARSGSFPRASRSMCLKGFREETGFLASSLRSLIRNSFLVSFSNLMILSFLGSFTSIYNYLISILCYSSSEYCFLTFCGLLYLKTFSDLMGGISGPSPFHSAFIYMTPLTSLSRAFCSSAACFFAASAFYKSVILVYCGYYCLLVCLRWSKRHFEKGISLMSVAALVSALTWEPGTSTLITSTKVSLNSPPITISS